MIVFVVNSGSSSLKYQLIDTDTGESLLSGIVDRIGEAGQAADHTEAMEGVLATIEGKHVGAVGHRVVHGGARFDRATLVTAEVEAEIDELSALAPLHNPANLLGIRAARAVMDVPQVVVFDTAFHQTMPPAAYTYALPVELAAKHGVRRYGFHGTSHKYVSERAAAFLDRPLNSLRQIVLHLGNGASITAIDGGRSVDTSMGLTPLQGLVMGTRSGDLDPAVLVHLHRVAGLSIDDLDDLVNKKSGLLGLTGSGDMRDVEQLATDGDDAALTALDVWCHRVRHYIGAYITLLGGVDVISFTAGVGEHSPHLRGRSLASLEFLGIEVDTARNEAKARGERRISPDGAAVEVLVIPTNEELEIARQVAALLG
jgi:acetate kinase